MKKRINEGGNIFKNADGQPDTIRINRVDVEPTVQWLETITGLELTDYKPVSYTHLTLPTTPYV